MDRTIKITGPNPTFKTYIEVLKNIFNKLDESQLDWRLVGGVALNFYLDKIPDPYRPNGSVRDLDIVILNYQPEKVKEMEAFFEKKKAEFNRAHPKMPIYPKVNLHTIIKEKQYLEKQKSRIIPQLVPHILRDGSRFFLQFRDILEEISPRILEPYFLEIKTKEGGLQVRSFNPQTLLHLYLNRTGYIKPKDVEKLKRFLREIRKMDIPELKEHNLYLPFHRFVKKMREKYKITTKLWQFYTLIDYKLFNSALTHKLIPDKIQRMLLNI